MPCMLASHKVPVYALCVKVRRAMPLFGSLGMLLAGCCNLPVARSSALFGPSSSPCCFQSNSSAKQPVTVQSRPSADHMHCQAVLGGTSVADVQGNMLLSLDMLLPKLHTGHIWGMRIHCLPQMLV